MSDKKVRRIGLIHGKLALFFGSTLFIASVATCGILLFIQMFLWLVLPVTLLIVSLFIIGHAFGEVPKKGKTEVGRLENEESETKVRRLEGESEENYQKAVALNKTLEKLHLYGKGERIQEEDSALFKQLKSSQTAHFMLSLQAEIEEKPSKASFLSEFFSSSSSSSALQQVAPQSPSKPTNFENTLVSLLEEADRAFPPAAKSLNEPVQDNSFIFNRLFTGVLKKTEITRKIFTGAFYCKLEKDKPIYQPVTKRLALFGIHPDGQCVDYSMGMYNREDTWKAITPYRDNQSFKQIMLFEMDDSRQIPGFNKDSTIQKLSKEFDSLREIPFDKKTNEQKKRWEELNIQRDARKKEVVNYKDNEKFMNFFKEKMQHEWLSDNHFAVTFCNDIRKDGKKLVLWQLRDFSISDKEFYKYESEELNPPSNEIYARNNPGPQNHYLHELGVGKHCNRLVEIDDFEGLIEGKRHENRFKLCQTQTEYELYRRMWVSP